MRYAVTRFGIFLLTIVVAITINFIVIHATPADPIAAMLGRMVTRGSSVAGGAQIVKVYTEAFALDQPLYWQYLLYVKNLLMGDLGYSLAYFPQKVSAVVLRAVPWSLGLLLFSVLLAFTIGNLLGALAVWRRAHWLLQGADLFLHDAVGDAVLPAGADPALPLRLPLADLPDRRDFTVGSSREFGLATALDFVHHATLPALSISLGLIGFWALSMRGVMATIMGEDFLVYARMKGLRERTIFLRYGMRNALLPQVSALAIDIGQAHFRAGPCRDDLRLSRRRHGALQRVAHQRLLRRARRRSLHHLRSRARHDAGRLRLSATRSPGTLRTGEAMKGLLSHLRLPVFIGIGLVLLALMPVLIGRFFVSPEMAEVFAGVPNLRPSLEHPLGTQSEGRDLLAVIMRGTPATLAIGLIGGGVAVLIGGILGFTAGYFGGRIDAVIRTIADIGLTIPPLAILIMIAAAFPMCRSR